MAKDGESGEVGSAAGCGVHCARAHVTSARGRGGGRGALAGARGVSGREAGNTFRFRQVLSSSFTANIGYNPAFILGRGDRGGCKVGRLVQYDKSYFVQVLCYSPTAGGCLCARVRARVVKHDRRGVSVWCACAVCEVRAVRSGGARARGGRGATARSASTDDAATRELRTLDISVPQRPEPLFFNMLFFQ